MLERQWYFDGYRLPESRYHSETDSDTNPTFSMSEDKITLTLKNAMEKRIGRYECKILDQNGQTVMEAHHVLQKSLTTETNLIPQKLSSPGMYKCLGCGFMSLSSITKSE